METKIIQANTHGQRVAAEVFKINDGVKIPTKTVDAILALLVREVTPKELPAWLSVGDIDEVNKATERVNALIAELQNTLASHGEGWCQLEHYATNGTDTALREAEVEMRDYLKRAKVPQVLHNQHLAAARASVDVGYFNAVAKALAALEREGIGLDDINNEGEKWSLSDRRAMAMYAAHIQRLTADQTQDLAIWSTIHSLENTLTRRGIDIENLRRSCPDAASAEVLREFYNPAQDERITAADRATETRLHQIFG